MGYTPCRVDKDEIKFENYQHHGGAVAVALLGRLLFTLTEQAFPVGLGSFQGFNEECVEDHQEKAGQDVGAAHAEPVVKGKVVAHGPLLCADEALAYQTALPGEFDGRETESEQSRKIVDDGDRVDD
jgi:hypothetical protein